VHYKLFGHVAHKLHNNKIDTIWGKSTRSVKLTSGGIHLRCADLGNTPIRWHINNKRRLLKRSVKNTMAQKVIEKKYW
jgi:hypothetical protein